MANKRSRPEVRSDAYYGPGASEHEARNPTYPGERRFKGAKYTIDSPHGSIFEGAPIHNDNRMTRAIEANMHGGLGRKKGGK